MHTALARAAELGADRAGWDVGSIVLSGVSYALWIRTLPEGVAAHADLGWATLAMWSEGGLPDIKFHVDALNDYS